MSDKNFNNRIQEVIDSEDYGELSRSLEKLVTEAVTDALGEIGDNVNKAADIIAGRKPIDRRPDYMKQKTRPNIQAQNPWMSDFDRKVFDYMMMKDLNGASIYSYGSLSRTQGWLLAILGLAGALGCFSGLLVLLIIGAVLHVGMLPVEILLLVIGALSAVMSAKGFGILAKLRRFKKYIKGIGKRVCVSIKELAGLSGKNEKDALKEIKEMISENMFLQGKLDAQEKNLYVTEDAYKLYMEELRKAQEEQTAAEIQRSLGLERAQKVKEELESLPPEVQKILTEGEGYIGMFRDSNKAIPDEVVSEKIASLEAMTGQIFSYVKEHPQAAAETKKLMKYYLPTTEKLLLSYQKLTEAEQSGLHPDQIPNIQRSKQEIEETLDTLNQAFARLFDNLYQDTSMDISADISVLNTLLAQEGLVGKDIRSQEVKEEEKGQVLQTY